MSMPPPGLPAASANLPPPYPEFFNPAVDASGTVAADSPCRKCGYNLRGLSISGRCPECGTAVGLSIHGDLLRFSDPLWVRKLQRGLVLILVSVALIVLIVIAMAASAAAGVSVIALYAPLLFIVT